MQSKNKALASEVEAFIAEHKFSEAFAALKQIRQHDYYLYQPELLQKIINALGEIEDVILQNKYLQEAITFVHNSKGVAFPFTSCFPLIERMAQRLFVEGESTRLEQLLTKAQKLANSIHRVRSRLAALAQMAQLYARMQKLDQALATVLLLKDPIQKAKLLINLAVVLSETQEKQQITRLLQEAQQITEEISDLEKKSATCLEMSRSIAPFAPMQTIIVIVQKIASPISRAKAFLDLASWFCRQSENDKAKQIWNQAIGVTQEITHNETKNTILVKIAAMAAQLGDTAAAKSIASQIKEDPHKLEVVAEIIQSLQRAEVLSLDSKFLLQKAIEICKNIKFHRCSFDFLQIALEKILRLEPQQQSGILQEIIRIARNEEPLLRHQTFFCIANELSRIGNYDQALQIVGTIEDNDYQFKALTLCIQNLAHQQRILTDSRTLEQILAMLRCKFAANKSLPLAIISRHLAINGSFVEALAIAAEITEVHHKVEALNDISDRFSMAPARVTAEVFLKQTLAIIETIEYFSSYKPIATTAALLAKVGEYAQALQILPKIGNKYYRFKVLREVVTIFSVDQQALQQNDIIDQMATIIANDFGEWHGQIMAKISQSLVNLGRHAKAMELGRQINDEYYCFEIFRYLLESIANQKASESETLAWQEALRLAEQMTDSFFKSELLCRIFSENQVDKSGYLGDGQRIASTIRDNLFRFEALKEIARNFIVLRQQEATELLTQLESLVQEFKYQETRAMALVEVGQLWQQLGNYKKADLAYQKFRQLFEDYDKENVEEHPDAQ